MPIPGCTRNYLGLLLLILPGCQTSPHWKEQSYLRRGEAMVRAKDYARAVLEFRNASAAIPADAEPQYRMGLAYQELGDTVAAIHAFQRAVVLNPQHAGAQLKLAGYMAGT